MDKGHELMHCVLYPSPLHELKGGGLCALPPCMSSKAVGCVPCPPTPHAGWGGWWRAPPPPPLQKFGSQARSKDLTSSLIVWFWVWLLAAFHVPNSYKNYFFLTFLFQPQIVLNLLLIFRRFEPHCSYFKLSRVKRCIYIAPFIRMLKGVLHAMISLPPANRKHIKASLAAASKRSMYVGPHFTDPGRMEGWVNFSGKEGHPNIQP